jgi:hypothetical protein
LNSAVIVCAPADSDDVVNAAWPASRGRTAKTESPSLIVNEPPSGICLGATAQRNPKGANVEPRSTGVTVAVNVTGCPTNDGFADEAKSVFVSATPGTIVVVVVVAVGEAVFGGDVLGSGAAVVVDDDVVVLVASSSTCWVSGVLMLGSCALVPVYWAVIVWVPADRAVVPLGGQPKGGHPAGTVQSAQCPVRHQWLRTSSTSAEGVAQGHPRTTSLQAQLHADMRARGRCRGCRSGAGLGAGQWAAVAVVGRAGERLPLCLRVVRLWRRASRYQVDDVGLGAG